MDQSDFVLFTMHMCIHILDMHMFDALISRTLGDSPAVAHTAQETGHIPPASVFGCVIELRPLDETMYRDLELVWALAKWKANHFHCAFVQLVRLYCVCMCVYVVWCVYVWCLCICVCVCVCARYTQGINQIQG